METVPNFKLELPSGRKTAHITPKPVRTLGPSKAENERLTPGQLQTMDAVRQHKARTT